MATAKTMAEMVFFMVSDQNLAYPKFTPKKSPCQFIIFARQFVPNRQSGKIIDYSIARCFLKKRRI
jgi:hypothetical protein